MVSTILPVASTMATLTPVRKPGSRPIVARPPAGAASRRSRRFRRRLSPPRPRPASRCAGADRRRDASRSSCATPSARSSRSQRSPGRPRSAMPKRWAIAQFEGARARLAGLAAGIGDEVEIENLLAFAAHQRERAMRRDFRQRLEEVEIIGEFGSRRLLALAHFRDDAGRASRNPRAAAPMSSASSAKRSTRIARAPSSASSCAS